jgi:hypothetical protein
MVSKTKLLATFVPVAAAYLFAALMTNNVVYAAGSQHLDVKITSVHNGEKVPVGKLTISGTSSATPGTKCEVYADWSDKAPYQLVKATGPGGANDYSKWKFTYTSKYHLITEGDTNNLTGKIECSGGQKAFNSVDVIGVTRSQN